MCLNNAPKVRLDELSVTHDLLTRLDLQSKHEDNCHYTDLPNVCASRKNLTVLHLNIQGLLSKISDLKSYLSDMLKQGIFPTLILLCETFLNKNAVNLCKIKSYDLITKHTGTRKDGGIAIYVHESVSYTRCADLEFDIDKIVESLFIEITSNDKTIVIGELYHIPNSDAALFNERYNNLLQSVKSELIIGANHNLDFLKMQKYKHAEYLFDLNIKNNLLPLIMKPTRITKSTATLIDNIFVSNKLCNNWKLYIATWPISDHLPCIVVLNYKVSCKKQEYTFKGRKMTEHNLSHIIQDLAQADWSALGTLNANDCYNYLVDRIMIITNIHAPELNIIVKGKKFINECWMTKGLLNSSLKCHNLYKACIRDDKTSANHIKFTQYRAMYQKIKHQARSAYFITQLNKFQSDSCNTWKIMNALIGCSNDKSTIPEYLMINDTKIYNLTSKLDLFSKHFGEVGERLANHIPKSKRKFMDY